MISLQPKGLSRVFSSTTVQKHQLLHPAFFMGQLSHPYVTTGEKTIALTLWTFVSKVMSLHFNTLSRFVIAFLPRSKLKFMSIKPMMLSNHFVLCCPLLYPPSIFPSIRVFSNELALCIRWPKYCSFGFSHSPFKERTKALSVTNVANIFS